MPSSRLIGAVGIVAGLLVLAVFAAPGVAAFGPEPDSPHVPASAPIRIEFSRSMDHGSVERRLSIDPPVPGEIEWDGDALLYHPIEGWPSGQDISVRLGAGSRSTRFLPLLRSIEWTFQVGEPRLTYLWPSEGPAELYLLDLSTQKRTQLTQTTGGVTDYSVAPGGNSIVYSSLGDDGSSEIRRLDLVQASDELIYACDATTRCLAPVISPDKQLLAFEQFEWETSEAGRQVPGMRHVLLMPLTSETEPRSVQPESQVTNSPDWSPGGLLTFYNQSLSAVAFLEPDSSQTANFVPNGLGYLGSWSPDGEYLILPEIVFPSETEQQGSDQADFFSHLYRVEAATMDVRDLSLGTVEDASPAYSPDGEWIAFARKFLDDRWTPGRQVWIMKSDGSRPRPLTDDPDFSHAALVWNPDSARLAYMRLSQTDPNVMPQIWMSDLDGSAQEFLVEGGYLPQWIP